MAGPNFYNMGDPEVVLQWEKRVLVEVAKKTALMNKRFGAIGEDDTNLVQRQKKVFEPGGTRATFYLTRQLRQKPTFGQQELRNREEGIDTSTFTLDINQVRHATAIKGWRITNQRVPINLYEKSITAMGEYWPTVMEAGAFAHLCGVPYDVSTTGEWYHDGSHLGITFGNVPVVPDTKHIYRPNHTSDTDDTNIGADPTAIIDTNVSAVLVAMAKAMPVPIRPATIHGRELYVLFVHPYQVAHLKENSRWLARMEKTLQGGAIDGNPLWSGALGIDSGVLWVESNYVFPGISSTNTRVANCRRAVFCGAQALMIGLAKQFEDESTFMSDEENWDYRNNKGTSATILAGFRSPRFTLNDQGTTEDFAKIVVPAYAKELVTSA